MGKAKKSKSLLKPTEVTTAVQEELDLSKEVGLEIQCGSNKALLYLCKLRLGSRGCCVLFKDRWLTPNEFQTASGRETAKDWKRSIRHGGKSLKLLLTKSIISLEPPAACHCEVCTGIEPSQSLTEGQAGTHSMDGESMASSPHTASPTHSPECDSEQPPIAPSSPGGASSPERAEDSDSNDTIPHDEGKTDTTEGEKREEEVKDIGDSSETLPTDMATDSVDEDNNTKDSVLDPTNSAEEALQPVDKDIEREKKSPVREARRDLTNIIEELRRSKLKSDGPTPANTQAGSDDGTTAPTQEEDGGSPLQPASPTEQLRGEEPNEETSVENKCPSPPPQVDNADSRNHPEATVTQAVDTRSVSPGLTSSLPCTTTTTTTSASASSSSSSFSSSFSKPHTVSYRPSSPGGFSAASSSINNSSSSSNTILVSTTTTSISSPVKHLSALSSPSLYGQRIKSPQQQPLPSTQSLAAAAAAAGASGSAAARTKSGSPAALSGPQLQYMQYAAAQYLSYWDTQRKLALADSARKFTTSSSSATSSSAGKSSTPSYSHSRDRDGGVNVKASSSDRKRSSLPVVDMLYRQPTMPDGNRVSPVIPEPVESLCKDLEKSKDDYIHGAYKHSPVSLLARSTSKKPASPAQYGYKNCGTRDAESMKAEEHLAMMYKQYYLNADKLAYGLSAFPAVGSDHVKHEMQGYKKNHNNNITVKDNHAHRSEKSHHGSSKRSYPFADGTHPLDLSTKRVKTSSSSNSRHLDNGLDLSSSSRHYSGHAGDSSAKHHHARAHAGPPSSSSKQSCVGDGIQVFQNTILNWDVEEVLELIKQVDGCEQYVSVFRDHKINGRGLAMLSVSHMLENLGMKMGPALSLNATLRKLCGLCELCAHCVHCHKESTGRTSR